LVELQFGLSLDTSEKEYLEKIEKFCRSLAILVR
jgi:hypothetical protein